MRERFKFWFLGYKGCSGCCLGGSHFNQCKEDILKQWDAEEAYERDITVEEFIEERLPENHRISA